MNNLPEIEFLLHLRDFGIKLGLEKTINLLEKFNNPHARYKSILIAGTNGKGSVAKTLATVLCEGGYSVGLYTSPHLVDIRERIVVNGQKISQDAFVHKIKQLYEILKKEPYHLYPTFFEAMTVLAFAFFADSSIDILVCEVGMGGRFDATNVLPSFMEVITSIGLEHTYMLGKTYAQIANEKAGIIKRNSTVVTAAQKEEALKVIREKAKENNARLYVYGKDFKAKKIGISTDGQEFNFCGKETYRHIKIPLWGSHQIENMSIALQALILMGDMGFPVHRQAIYSGLKNVSWPGRFQIIRHKPLWIIDGAHNPDGLKTLMRSLRALFPGEDFSLLMGILKDKDWRKMIEIIERNKNIKEIVFTAPDTGRAMDPEVLASFVKRKDIKRIIIPDYKKAYRYMKQNPVNWCVCGSLYLCGNILPLTGHQI